MLEIGIFSSRIYNYSELACTYRQAMTMFTEEIAWLTTEDKEWIMGRSVCEWLGWDLGLSVP